MAIGGKSNFFSILKNWLRIYQIVIINTLIMVIFIALISFILLSRGSDLQRRAAEDSVVNLAGMITNEIKASYIAYFELARTISYIFNNYQSIDVNLRRAFVNDVMLGLLSANPGLLNIYALWRPNELDGMDARFANTIGTDETGQFLSGFTRERGFIEQRAFVEYRNLLEIDFELVGWMHGISSAITSRPGEWEPFWVIEIQIPIMHDDTMVGVTGLTVNMGPLQELAEATRPFETGQIMVLTSRSSRYGWFGSVIAHSDSLQHGRSFFGYTGWDPLFAGEMGGIVFSAKNQSLASLEPAIVRTEDNFVVIHPLMASEIISGIDHDFFESNIPRWAVITAVPMSAIFGPFDDLIVFSIFFIIGAGALAAFVIFLSSKNLTLRANLLQENLEFTKSLQDKLKQGLFMINRDLTFKQTHSRTIHEILSVPSLEGKNLSDILSASIDQKSMMSLIDYLEMVFEGSLDQKMLDEINPIHVFNYQNPETGERKVLKTDFARVTERGNTFVMGTVEDITEKSDLEMEFSDEESQKDKEMRALFQVVQLDSQVLMDFIEDAEHEFEGINEILKGEKQLHQDKLTEVFQSLHSIKSNALILNLETFADKLHKMESSVKKLQENKGYFGGMIPFDAILSLVLELDETMKEMDHLETAVSKIVNYKTVSDEKADQKRQVLEETLIQICNKTSSALNKNARLLVSEIDVLALDYGPRRVIKEVITQLIRNAIYHGIEAPGQRTALGKDPEGEIRVSVVCKNDQIVIKVSDDGSGIDLEKLKQKVKSSKLLQNLIDINNKNFLLQMLFSPGFSTAQEADLHAGRGIGLSLVKDRIKDLRGNIKISTFSGKGTTFTLSIPMEIPQSAKVS